jgi:hypothetical protein
MSTPEGGYGVADELVDLAAELLDDGLGSIEVAGEHPTYFFGVSGLTERGEPDEIGEQD